MRVNSGADWQSIVMGGDLHGEVGTATATTATSITTNSSTSHAANDLVGHRIIATTPNPPVEGTITANTAGTNTTTTVDRWVVPGTTTAATTPGATTNYAILSGGAPGAYIALNTNATAPAATDTMAGTFAANELEAVGGGLVRARATYSHTIGTASYSLTNTWTANSNDGASNTINKIGVVNSPVASAGMLTFETAVPSPPTLVSGDTIQITETINI